MVNGKKKRDCLFVEVCQNGWLKTRSSEHAMEKKCFLKQVRKNRMETEK